MIAHTLSPRINYQIGSRDGFFLGHWYQPTTAKNSFYNCSARASLCAPHLFHGTPATPPTQVPGNSVHEGLEKKG